MLARSLLETLRSVYESNDNCVAVLDAMVKLSEDPGKICCSAVLYFFTLYIV